ncbi:hypothetical protein TNCT_637871 [Trichonephila clavata]|uniref:Uncharacterized protein n=1 Tax=Trichonephila clavata TaxID=2740835 RepID=A0A8X6HLS8_TRICU|nr:hypothetical protein TNCT_637871 [Trichonephila clavata]
MASRILESCLLSSWLIFVLLVVATSTADNENQYSIHMRNKRDLAYLKELDQLVEDVEKTLEEFDVTEDVHGACQLQATCELYKINAEGLSNRAQKNFIDRVEKLRKEYNDQKIEREPKAKKLFSKYDRAAQNGEDQVDCDKEYSKCKEPLDSIKREGGNGNSKTTASY